jgi:hypothetical protein
MFPGSRPTKSRKPTSTSNRTSTTANQPMEQSQEMGMTAERQREIQASLFKMLGQQDDEIGAQSR